MTVLERTFNILTDRELLVELRTSIWQYKEDTDLSWATESNIQGFVKIVVLDIITATGLSDKLKCFSKMSVFKLRPGKYPKPGYLAPTHSPKDIWVVLNGYIPAGIIEVKTPGCSVFRSEYIAGQMLDYLLRLQTFHGLQWVFGKLYSCPLICCS